MRGQCLQTKRSPPSPPSRASSTHGPTSHTNPRPVETQAPTRPQLPFVTCWSGGRHCKDGERAEGPHGVAAQAAGPMRPARVGSRGFPRYRVVPVWVGLPSSRRAASRKWCELPCLPQGNVADLFVVLGSRRLKSPILAVRAASPWGHWCSMVRGEDRGDNELVSGHPRRLQVELSTNDKMYLRSMASP